MLQSPLSTVSPPQEDDPRLFRWNGEFRDPELERQYRAASGENQRRLLRIYAWTVVVSFLIMIGRDYLQHGLQDSFYHATVLRLVGAGSGLGLLLALHRLNRPESMECATAISMVIFTLLVFLVWAVNRPPGLTAAAIVSIVLLAWYMLLPIGAAAILPNAALLSLGTATTVILLADTAETLYAVNLLLFCNLVGFFGMRRLKRQRRSNQMLREQAGQAVTALGLMRQESDRRSEYQAWALDALQVGVLLFTPDHHLHTINRRAAELLLLPSGSFVPGDHYEVLLRALSERDEFGQLGVEDMRHHIQRLLRGDVGTLSARLASTGQVLEFTLRHLPDNSVAVVISDASERYALHRRLRHSVEVAGDGFALYDASDRIAVCSSRFAALYGLTVEQAVGMTYEDLLARAYERGVFDPDERGPGSTAVVGQTRRRIPERMIEIRTRAGEWFLVHERITPTGDLVVVRTNITARRRMEDELRRAKEEAERALAELRDAQANLVMAEKMASLGSLVAGMSHEISTPLGIGVSAASHLEDEVAKLATAFRADGLKRGSLEDFLETATEANRIMQSNLSRAARLIQAFKQIAADQSNDEVRSFRVAEYLHELMLSLAPALRKVPHKVEIECPEELTIRNRPGAFGQIVTNLVMNAVQHAFEGREEPGRIRIVVTQPRQGRITIEFSDNGHGIAEEFLPKVFDPFFTTKRGAGGTGLGLHIVYNLVSQVLGGAIAVSSREWEGTRFTISFPQDAKTE